MNTVILVLVSLVCGLLGALSGADNSNKLYRRFLIPLILCWIGLYLTKSYYIFGLMLLFIPLSLGYGMPVIGEDKGSWLGRFWLKIIKNYEIAEVMVRLTIGAIILVVLSLIPYINQQWTSYLCNSMILMLIIILIGGDTYIQNEGRFKLFNKQLLVEEFILYFSLAFFTIATMLGV